MLIIRHQTLKSSFLIWSLCMSNYFLSLFFFFPSKDYLFLLPVGNNLLRVLCSSAYWATRGRASSSTSLPGLSVKYSPQYFPKMQKHNLILVTAKKMKCRIYIKLSKYVLSQFSVTPSRPTFTLSFNNFSMKNIAANRANSIVPINQMAIFIMCVTIAPTACDILSLLFS